METTGKGLDSSVVRLTVTGGAMGVVALCSLVPIAYYAPLGGDRQPVYAWGIQSLVMTCLLVELVASVIPVFRKYRVGCEGRSRLMVSGYLLAVLWIFWTLSNMPARLGDSLDVSTSRFAFLQGGVMILQFVIAWIVSRWGLVQGIALVAIEDVAIGEIRNILQTQPTQGQVLISSFALHVFTIGIIVVATLWLFGVNLRRSIVPVEALSAPSETADSDIYRAEPESPALAQPRSVSLPSPGSGTVFLVFTAAFGSFLSQLSALGMVSTKWALGISQSFEPMLGLLGLLLIAPCVYVFYSRSAVLSIHQRAGFFVPGLASAFDQARRQELVRCIVWGIVIFAANWFCNSLTHHSINAVIWVCCTALALDGYEAWLWFHEFPDGSVVWSDSRPYAVPVALEILADKGINAFARGVRFRSILQIFGPHAPIELFVASKKKTAQKRLNRVLGSTDES